MSFITSLQKIECKINLNELKLKVNDTYEKDEKITTKFEPSGDGDVVNKADVDTELFKVEGRILFIEKVCNEFEDLERSNKQSDQEF